MRVMHDTRVATTTATLNQLVANALPTQLTPACAAMLNATGALQEAESQDGAGATAQTPENSSRLDRTPNANMLWWNRRA